MMPRGKAMDSAISIVSVAISNVNGNREPIISSTGVPSSINSESPQSRVTTPRIQSRYCS